MHGAGATAGTSTSTGSSSKSCLSLYARIATSSLNTSPVRTIPPILLHTGFSPALPSSSPQAPSQTTLHSTSVNPPMAPPQQGITPHGRSEPKPLRPTVLTKALQANPSDSPPSPISSSTVSSQESSASQEPCGLIASPRIDSLHGAQYNHAHCDHLCSQ